MSLEGCVFTCFYLKDVSIVSVTRQVYASEALALEQTRRAEEEQRERLKDLKEFQRILRFDFQYLLMDFNGF